MCTVLNLKYLWQVVPAFLTHHTLLDQKILRSLQNVRICLMWGHRCRHREGQVNIPNNPTFVVDVEPVILTPACDVVTVSCQADKVLLINMTCRVKNMHICHQKIWCSHHLWRTGRSDFDSHSTTSAGSPWRQRRCPHCSGTWRMTLPCGDP